MGRTQVILIDTHVVVWLALDQTHLSKNARAAIDDARQNGDGLAISDISHSRRFTNDAFQSVCGLWRDVIWRDMPCIA
jgi:hypothetical protein